MSELTCRTCVHFKQHYVVDDQRCVMTDWGHCAYPRSRQKRPDTKACAHYEERTEPVRLPDRDGVIRFLTTEMLQHILSLELPMEVVEE